jgi:hypothetical protein
MMMMMVPAFAVTTAHTFVLTVSHGLLFRQPLLSATAVCRRFFSIHPKSITSAERRTKFRLNVQSRYSARLLLSPSPLRSPIRQTGLFPGSFGRGVQNSSRRASHDCLRAEPMKRHDLSTI